MNVRSRLVSLLIVFVGVDFATAQTLAEAAKKEQQRRKTASSPGKTYTENDLTAVRPADSTPASAGGGSGADGSAATATSKASSPSNKQGEGEAYWRGRFRAARERIVKAEAEVKRLEDVSARFRSNGATITTHDCSAQEAAGKPGDRILIRSCPQTGTTFLGELEAARNAVTEARQALSDLETEARQRGALPAWSR